MSPKTKGAKNIAENLHFHWKKLYNSWQLYEIHCMTFIFVFVLIEYGTFGLHEDFEFWDHRSTLNIKH